MKSSEWLLTRYPAVDKDALSSMHSLIEKIQNPWAIHPEVAVFLAKLIAEEQTHSIVEFGAGSSSMIFSLALQENGGGVLLSYEENPAWCAEAWKSVEANQNVDAHLNHASTKLVFDSRGLYFGYNACETSRPHVDLAFIDAPHGSLGRSGAFYCVANSLRVGGLVIVDDVARARDEAAVIRWLRQYPDFRLSLLDKSLGRGVAVLERVKETNRWRFVLKDVFFSMFEIIRARKSIAEVRAVATGEIQQA